MAKLVRVVKASIRRIVHFSIAAGLLLALVVPLAHAEPSNARLLRENRRQALQQQRNQDDAASFVQREQGERDARPQRLSPDERRQLRRDIRNAGRELYLRRQ